MARRATKIFSWPCSLRVRKDKNSFIEEAPKRIHFRRFFYVFSKSTFTYHQNIGRKRASREVFLRQRDSTNTLITILSTKYSLYNQEKIDFQNVQPIEY